MCIAILSAAFHLQNMIHILYPLVALTAIDILLYLNPGSGGNGREIRGFLESVPLKEFDYKTFAQVLIDRNIDLVTPTSSMRPYMPCGGERMNVWFNRAPTVFRNGPLDTYEDVAGTNESMTQILDHVRSVSTRYSNVFIGGLSMGGGLALYLLSSPLPESVRGIFSMGSFLIEGTSLFQQPRPGGFENNRVPVLMMHG